MDWKELPSGDMRTAWVENVKWSNQMKYIAPMSETSFVRLWKAEFPVLRVNHGYKGACSYCATMEARIRDRCTPPSHPQADMASVSVPTAG